MVEKPPPDAKSEKPYETACSWPPLTHCRPASAQAGGGFSRFVCGVCNSAYNFSSGGFLQFNVACPTISIASQPGVVTNVGYSCDGASSTPCNSIASVGKLPMGSCIFACNPCKYTDCAWQYFTYSANTISQYVGTNSTCVGATFFHNYTCGQCDLFDNLPANNNLVVQANCPVTTPYNVSVYCPIANCSSQVPSFITLTTNQCTKYCNPCNATDCQWQTYQLDGTGKVYQMSYPGKTCNPSLGVLSNTFQCGTCYSGILFGFNTVSISFPCPNVGNSQLLTLLLQGIFARVLRDDINGLSVAALTAVLAGPGNPTIGSGTLSFTFSLVTDGSQSGVPPSVSTAISNAVSNGLLAPSQRIGITVSPGKKRASAFTSTATVVISPSNTASTSVFASLWILMAMLFFVIDF